MVKVFGPLVEMARLQNEINKIFESVLELSPEDSLQAASGCSCRSRPICCQRSFSRTIALPVPVNTHRASARLHEGLLTVTFPRVQNRRGEDISIVIETE